MSDAATAHSEPRAVSGRVVILTVFALAIAATAGSWWYYAALRGRAVAFWGRDTATHILRAPAARIAVLGPVAGASRQIATPSGAVASPSTEADLSSARGFVHIRNSLVNDLSFDWDADPTPTEIVWRYAIELADAEGAPLATLVLSADCRFIGVSGRSDFASLAPIARELAAFVGEQFPTAAR